MSVESAVRVAAERVNVPPPDGAPALVGLADVGGLPLSAVTRGAGVTEALSQLPNALVVLFALLTQLGDPWFLFVLFAALHWLGSCRLGLPPGRRTALLLGLALGALALTTGLKAVFGLPRPAGAATAPPPAWLPAAFDPAFREFATGEGFAFPSGHAIGSTVAYGALAALSEAGTPRARRLTAASLVGVVCLSRLVLGVHYAVDVVAGVAVGVVYLAVAFELVDGRPRRAYALAAAVSAFAVGVAVAAGHPAREAVAGLGATLGGFVVWYAVEERDRTAYATDVGVPAAAAGLAVTGGIWVATYAAAPPLPMTLLANALTVGGVLALPTVVVRIRKRRGVGVEAG